MKIKIDFVTNSSTACYLVVSGKLRGDGLTPEILRAHIDEYMTTYELKYEWHGEPLEEKIDVEEYDDDFTFKVYVQIPFHKVINSIKAELERQFTVYDYDVSEFELYVHVEYDG